MLISGSLGKKGVIARQCAHCRGNPPDFPRTNSKRVGAAIGRPLFYALFVEEQCSKVSSKVSYNKCHCEPVVLRAANQNLNDCQWQSYLNVAHTGVAIPLKCPRTLERVPCLSLWERCPAGAERAFYPLSHCVTAPPEWEPRGNEGNGLPFRKDKHDTKVCERIRGSLRARKPTQMKRNCNLICS